MKKLKLMIQTIYYIYKADLKNGINVHFLDDYENEQIFPKKESMTIYIGDEEI